MRNTLQPLNGWNIIIAPAREKVGRFAINNTHKVACFSVKRRGGGFNLGHEAHGGSHIDVAEGLGAASNLKNRAGAGRDVFPPYSESF